jgi:outer membrane lipoprotein
MVNKSAGILVLCLLGGCIAIPEQIKVSQGQTLIKFNDVSDNSVGETVRWGGVITGLSQQDDVTSVIVTQYALLDSGQPAFALGSDGRFNAKLKSPLNIDKLEEGTVITIIGKVEELQNPYPDLRTTQLAIVQADDFYIWNGFSRADHPTVLDKDKDNDPAFIQRGKWGWQVKSEKEMQRERQERKNQQNSRY